jgi:hypothetical protein
VKVYKNIFEFQRQRNVQKETRRGQACPKRKKNINPFLPRPISSSLF